jgi:hypothetical protein
MRLYPNWQRDEAQTFAGLGSNPRGRTKWTGSSVAERHPLKLEVLSSILSRSSTHVGSNRHATMLLSYSGYCIRFVPGGLGFDPSQEHQT